jgi:peptide deformylase
MVKQIIRDPLFLQQKSEPATEADKQVITDLTDTLKANSDRCVGMAANMIGSRKRIIIVSAGPFSFIIFPQLTQNKQ